MGIEDNVAKAANAVRCHVTRVHWGEGSTGDKAPQSGDGV
jgi:hypothetical protein